MTRQKLTEMETQALDCLKGLLEGNDEGFSDTVAEDISHDTGIPMKQLRGVISSLIKKEYVYVLEAKVNKSFGSLKYDKYNFLYLDHNADD